MTGSWQRKCTQREMDTHAVQSFDLETCKVLWIPSESVCITDTSVYQQQHVDSLPNCLPVDGWVCRLCQSHSWSCSSDTTRVLLTSCSTPNTLTHTHTTSSQMCSVMWCTGDTVGLFIIQRLVPIRDVWRQNYIFAGIIKCPLHTEQCWYTLITHDWYEGNTAKTYNDPTSSNMPWCLLANRLATTIRVIHTVLNLPVCLLISTTIRQRSSSWRSVL